MSVISARIRSLHTDFQLNVLFLEPEPKLQKNSSIIPNEKQTPRQAWATETIIAGLLTCSDRQLYLFHVANCRGKLRGPPLDGGGGGAGWSFCLAIFIYFTREMESFICSPQDKLYFHHALWPFIYFTHFSHKNIYFQKSPAPHSILMVAP